MVVRQILLNIFLAFVWMLFQNTFSVANFLTGFVIGAIILFVFRRSFPGQQVYLSRVTAVVNLILVFLWELFKANLTVAALVLSREIKLSPAIVAIPVDLDSDLGIVLLANMITLTPGTLTVDISPDKTRLYVHVLNVTDEDLLRKEIKDKFEKRIFAVLGGGQ